MRSHVFLGSQLQGVGQGQQEAASSFLPVATLFLLFNLSQCLFFLRMHFMEKQITLCPELHSNSSAYRFCGLLTLAEHMGQTLD